MAAFSFSTRVPFLFQGPTEAVGFLEERRRRRRTPTTLAIEQAHRGRVAAALETLGAPVVPVDAVLRGSSRRPRGIGCGAAPTELVVAVRAQLRWHAGGALTQGGISSEESGGYCGRVGDGVCLY